MWILIGVQLFIVLLLFTLGWAIRKMEANWLIPGFSTRSEEEQQQLIENGYPQKIGTLLIATAAGMAILLPLNFTPFKYVMEVQFGFMFIFLLGGFIYPIPTKDPHFKESEGQSPMSKWEMNVGWR
ncbi:DUF3784 domain-containing protein [Bacillus methanolicus]|uniref:Putative membrane protein n=1 Tax=Bacillus methanolicus (strain MGA3 / ATCC 53907) TaxID=796606 RepID=I3E362_BACMM|nr:DUF3784 domain-containing protein [Bacillus methanolicus]AIE58973.1 putative membrane protein [Bacillus methanolicus MGA3]EIJ80933.1 hypothetical protein MGA3_11580 [Bacillus methanolicus MGA3]